MNLKLKHHVQPICNSYERKQGSSKQKLAAGFPLQKNKADALLFPPLLLSSANIAFSFPRKSIPEKSRKVSLSSPCALSDPPQQWVPSFAIEKHPQNPSEKSSHRRQWRPPLSFFQLALFSLKQTCSCQPSKNISPTTPPRPPLPCSSF